MADHSGITWTTSTWNPVIGCQYTSPGCLNCYAARDASTRLRHLPLYAGLAENGEFTGEVRLVPERLHMPLHWRAPRRVFVNSVSDLFHDDVPNDFIAQVFAVMASSAAHVFQVLTKRHGRMRSLLNNPDFRNAVTDYGIELLRTKPSREQFWPGETWALPNVWLGVSAEDQHWADIRIPALLDTPAAIRWVSAEPLLGPISLRPEWLTGTSALDWVVVGGESGRAARPMEADWALTLQEQCEDAGTSFFFKQAGAVLAKEWGLRGTGAKPEQWPIPLRQEFPPCHWDTRL